MSEQQQHPQQPTSPVQPANFYTPPVDSPVHSPVHSPDAILTTPQGQSHQALPPSYDQAKTAPHGVPVPGPNGVAATVVPLNMLGDEPQPIDCPFCHRRTMTEIRKEGSSMQILVGALFCLVCVCLTCVPCLAHWFEDAEYRCNQCKNLVARRRHDGPMEVLGPQAAVYSQYGGQPQMTPQGQQAHAAPVQAKDASGLAQPQQYEMQPQQQYHQQQQQQQHYEQQQHQHQHHYEQQQHRHSGQVQEIQPAYHQPQQYQQQQHAQAGTPQPDQKH